MRVAVIGLGAIGAYTALTWTRAGHEVVGCGRHPVEEYRLVHGGREVRVEAHVVTDLADVKGPVPWVVLAVKAHQTPSAAPWLKALCDDGTIVVAAQNGLDHRNRVVPFARRATVLPSALFCGAESPSPGVVLHEGQHRIVVPAGDPGDRFAAWADVPGLEVATTDDFTTVTWRKLAGNAALSGPTALALRTSEVLRAPAVHRLAVRLVAECYAAGRAEGAALDPATALELVDAIAALPPTGTSMLFDRRAGRPSEWRALYGAILEAAQRHDLAAPATELMAALLRYLDPGEQ